MEPAGLELLETRLETRDHLLCLQSDGIKCVPLQYESFEVARNLNQSQTQHLGENFELLVFLPLPPTHWDYKH